MNLSARLSRVEGQVSAQKRHCDRKVFCVVLAKGDDEAAIALARLHGLREDDENHLLILQSVVTPNDGRPRYQEPPYMLSKL